MSLTVTVSRWGNSIAVRLPKKVVDHYQLSPGSVLNLTEENDHFTLSPDGDPQTLNQLIEMTPEEDRLLRAKNWEEMDPVGYEQS